MQVCTGQDNIITHLPPQKMGACILKECIMRKGNIVGESPVLTLTMMNSFFDSNWYGAMFWICN